MNLQEFINKYSGKRVDDSGKDRWNEVYYTVTNKNGKVIRCWYHQCGSVVKIYVRQVLNTQARGYGGDGGVANGWNNNAVFPFTEYTHIKNAQWVIPKAGDIVIFERHEKNWNYGHIGIIVSADNQGYKILEQNAGHGLGYWRDGDEITIRYKKYTDTVKILGYVRHKSLENNPLWRRNVAKRIFDALKKPRFIGHSAAEIWNLLNPMQITTRSEVAGMIKNYFSRIEKRNIDESRIWNKTRPNDPVSKSELDTMISRAKSL